MTPEQLRQRRRERDSRKPEFTDEQIHEHGQYQVRAHAVGIHAWGIAAYFNNPNILAALEMFEQLKAQRG